MRKSFERILIVMFENQYRSYVIQDPFMRKLARAGTDMTHFFGVYHPSQTNYVASLAGEVCAVSNDTPPAAPLMQQTLVDLLEAADVDWRAYMEAYPGDPWNPNWKNPNYPAAEQPLTEFPNDGVNLARYFRKHNPFASFHTIQADEARWQKIVGEPEFWGDVLNNKLPPYAWFSPDIWNDGHYLYNTHLDTNPRTQLVPQLSTWLEYVFFGNPAAGHVQGGTATGQPNIGLNLDIDLLLTQPKKAWKQSRVPEGTLIVITFDEADYDAAGYDTNYDGPNQVYTVLLGDMITPGTTIATPQNHYTLIKTVEKNFGLGSLGKNDRGANWIRQLWGRTFRWSKPREAGFETGRELALARLFKKWHLVFQGQDNSLMIATCKRKQWSEPTPTGLIGGGPLALCAYEEALQLVYADPSGNLMHASFDHGSGWTAGEALNQATAGSLAMTAYEDYADGKQKLLLCWQGADQFIRALHFSDGAWEAGATHVGQLTDGPMTVSQLGPSLFLVYKERNTRQMRITSYNLAPFNSFEALTFEDQPAPQNSTSLHQWSPADFPVGHFAGKSTLR